MLLKIPISPNTNCNKKEKNNSIIIQKNIVIQTKLLITISYYSF